MDLDRETPVVVVFSERNNEVCLCTGGLLVSVGSVRADSAGSSNAT